MPEPTPFRPFDTLLDEAEALRVLRAATDGAEDGELFLERRRSEVIRVRRWPGQDRQL